MMKSLPVNRFSCARRMSVVALVAAATLATATCSAWAFTVVKNINSGKPLVEKAVIFEKGKPTDHLSLHSTDSCKTVFTADGTIESKIVGSDEVNIVINWKPRGELKESFDTKDYTYLLLTCRLEGNIKNPQPNGKMVEQRADNLWFPVTILNADQERVGNANLADVSEDGKTPDKTVTLKIPMVVLTFGGKDTSKIQGIGFYWSKGKPGSQRDFRLVIDKIALAE